MRCCAFPYVTAEGGSRLRARSASLAIISRFQSSQALDDILDQLRRKMEEYVASRRAQLQQIQKRQRNANTGMARAEELGKEAESLSTQLENFTQTYLQPV